MSSELRIGKLRLKDHQKIIDFAIQGMHFYRYLPGRFAQQVYGRYFLYYELVNATHVLAAYRGDEFAGVLLAELYGEKKRYRTPFRLLYVKIVEWIGNRYFEGSFAQYDSINTELLKLYRQDVRPDGEMKFFAVDPDAEQKGTGSFLLKEFETQAAGMEIFLFTDDQCSYEFYDHRGFERRLEKTIKLSFDDGREMPLRCFLYRKKTAER